MDVIGDVWAIFAVRYTVDNVEQNFVLNTQNSPSIYKVYFGGTLKNIWPNGVLCKICWTEKLIIDNKIKPDHAGGSTVGWVWRDLCHNFHYCFICACLLIFFDFLQSDWLQQRAAFYDILTVVQKCYFFTNRLEWKAKFWSWKPSKKFELVAQSILNNCIWLH